MNGIKTRGVSLYPFTDNSYYSDPFAYSEGSGYLKYMTEKWSLICKMEDWTCELYDLENDPMELNNLIEIKKDIASGLKEKLFSTIDKTMYESADRVKPKKVKAKIISDETKETLKSLGYLQ